MIINSKAFGTCPAHNQKVTLNVGYNKKKSSPKDIGFDYNYIGVNCDFTRAGKHCPYVDCPLVETLDLRRCIFR